MKIQRTKNAGRNIFYGTVLKCYQIVIPFLMRTLMIYQMGLEYAGLNNLFASIFQFLNLAELGIGAALTFSMYEPIARDDSDRICALLKLYRKCFNVIGSVILGLGLLCLPFLKYLVSGSIPAELNLHYLYLLYLGNTVLSYWLFSYKTSLLYAHQRNDINSRILIVTSTIQYVLQAFVLFTLKNYYLYVISSIITQIVYNMVAMLVVNKTYTYRPRGHVEKEVWVDIKKRTQGLVTNKFGGVVFRSADSIVLSSILGLVALARYQNYYYIITAVISVTAILYEACVAGIGNSLIVEKKEKNYKDFCSITFLVGILSGVCCACFICVFQPFMTVWMGKENVLEFRIVISFAVYFFVYEMDQLIGTFKDAAGIWYQDRYRPLITAAINLTLNIIIVRSMGIYGALLSTIISICLVGMPWLLYNVFHNMFKGMPMRRYLYLLLKLFGATVITCAITYWVTSRFQLSGWLGVFILCFLSGGIATVIQCLLLIKSKEFNSAFSMVKRMVLRR